MTAVQTCRFSPRRVQLPLLPRLQVPRKTRHPRTAEENGRTAVAPHDLEDQTTRVFQRTSVTWTTRGGHRDWGGRQRSQRRAAGCPVGMDQHGQTAQSRPEEGGQEQNEPSRARGRQTHPHDVEDPERHAARDVDGKRRPELRLAPHPRAQQMRVSGEPRASHRARRVSARRAAARSGTRRG